MKLILRASRVLALGTFSIAEASSVSDVGRITFLKPDIALVRATWEWPGFIQPSGDEWKDFNGIITMVLVKRDDKWLIRALQNTVTSPLPKSGR